MKGIAQERELLSFIDGELYVYTYKLSCAIGKRDFDRIRVAYTVYFDCICKRPQILGSLITFPGFSIAHNGRMVLYAKGSFYLSSRLVEYYIKELEPEDVALISSLEVSNEEPILTKL